MKKPKGYRTCFVPMCFNTSKRTPDKLFFFVPKDEKIRNLWFRLASRTDLPTSKTHYFCCEDHFNFKEDMENYLRFSLIGGPLKLKPNVVPHKFDCCGIRKRPPILKPRRQFSEKKSCEEEQKSAHGEHRRGSQQNDQTDEKESCVNEPEEETSNQSPGSVLSTMKVEIDSELDPSVSSQNSTFILNQNPQTRKRKLSSNSNSVSSVHDNKSDHPTEISQERKTTQNSDYDKRIDNLDNVSQVNKSTDNSDDEYDNRNDNLDQVSQENKSTYDSDYKYDTFGKLISMQLRELPIYNALSSEKRILSVIIKQRIRVLSSQETIQTKSKQEQLTSSQPPLHFYQEPYVDEPVGEGISNRLFGSPNTLDTELDPSASSSYTKRKPRILKRKPTLKRNLISSEHDNNHLDQVSQASECIDNSDDEYDAFGKLVAIQLRQLPLSNALICQEQIQTLIKKQREQGSLSSHEITETEIKQEPPPTSTLPLNFLDIKMETLSDTESITEEFQ